MKWQTFLPIPFPHTETRSLKGLDEGNYYLALPLPVYMEY